MICEDVIRINYIHRKQKNKKIVKELCRVMQANSVLLLIFRFSINVGVQIQVKEFFQLWAAARASAIFTTSAAVRARLRMSTGVIFQSSIFIVNAISTATKTDGMTLDATNLFKAQSLLRLWNA